MPYGRLRRRMTSQSDWDEVKKILDEDYAPVSETVAKENVEYLMGLYEAFLSDGVNPHEV